MSLLTFVTALGHLTEAPAVARNVSSIASVNDVIADEGTPFADLDLPGTVNVTFSNGAVEATPVEWGSVDYDTEVGLYVLTGVLNLSGSDTNTGNLTASVDVIVDNPTANGDDWTEFNGYSHYIKYGDILDAHIASATPYIEFECKIRNVPITGTYRLFTKAEFTTNQRSFLIQIVDGDVSFTWWTAGTTARVRAITWADALTDTNEHTLRFEYDGAVSTNAGLDRIKLFIDEVEITAGKSLTQNTGTIGGIFNGTAQLAFGTVINAAGTVATDQTTWFKGEAKDLYIRDSTSDLLSSINIDRTATHGTYKKYQQPVYNGTRNASAVDSCQASLNAIAEDDDNFYMYVLASNPAINSDRDDTTLAIKPKDNNISTGWVKQLDAGLPEVIYSVGAVGKFDAKQCWLRNVLWDGSQFVAFPIGQSATDTFALGKSTSPDLITWTRQNSGDPVLTDGTTDLTIAHIIYDADADLLRGVFCGNQYGERYVYRISDDWGDTWTTVETGFLAQQGLGWVTGYQYINGVHFIWAAKRYKFFSGIADDIVLYTTTDFDTFTFYGPQLTVQGGTDHAQTSAGNMVFRLPDGRWALAVNMYKNHVGKSANLGEEFTAVKVAVLNRTDLPIAGKACVFEYPSYVIEHYPMNRSSNSGTSILEAISGEFATINSTPVYTVDAAYGNRTLGFMDLNGSQNITRATTLPAGFNPANFGIKLRVEIVTTGTHTLFQIGDSSSNRGILITLESGKMRVRLSADGTNWTKDWIRTANLAKPTGMNYIDNHIYLAVHFASSTLTLYNDFELVDAANITETVDGAVASMHYTNGSRVIGENATLEMRSVSICSPVTAQELIDLEI